MHCNSTLEPAPTLHGGSIALVGHPNVGKSVIFQKLTGQRVIVSNYPGTTVEVMRGAVRRLPETSLIDTPGVITFPPHSDDEQVTAQVLLNEPLRAILQVGDAKNLRRTLLLSAQLAEMGRPLVLALNMMDEAQQRGMQIDLEHLSGKLGCSVVATTATRSQGLEELLQAVQQAAPNPLQLTYPLAVEQALAEFEQLVGPALAEQPPIALRALGLLWLSGDAVSEDWLRAHLPDGVLAQANLLRQQAAGRAGQPLALEIQAARQAWAENCTILGQRQPEQGHQGFAVQLGRLATHPTWGWFLLLAILYAVYWFVGIWGAGTLVGLLEKNLFGAHINPWINSLVRSWVPWHLAADLLVGEYGLWTMGVTYALALILPIVTTFFLAFGILEDSGYLPRLAALSNRLFCALGLNGKAVLPMVLGLGCVTMATLTTRVLESKRERLLVTLLLALAVPCSAQLGVVMGMLASISLGATLLWGSVIVLVLFLVGWLAARLVPGERNELLVELPPLRLPQASNVLMKTLARLEWYIKEVVPLFLIGATVMFVLDETGLLEILTRAGEPLVTGWLGLPPQASAAFLMGFMRRDFGATGLFLMQSHGLLTPVQVVVAMVTITLFIPCVASVMMISRERGWRVAVGMVGVIFPLAFLAGGLLNRALLALGWGG